MVPTTAIIITFQPDLEVLIENIRAIDSVGVGIIVYDNSEKPEVCEAIRTLCREHHIPYMGGMGNLGIAHAQNQAVESLGEVHDEATVLFLDQDSVVDPQMISDLRASFTHLKSIDPSAGILGALPMKSDGTPYRIEGRGVKANYLVPDFVISSGSILRVKDFRNVGGLRDDLFIDLVDNDLSWRLRLNHQGLYIDPEIKFRHAVGTGKTVTFMGRQSPLSSPIRHYYQIRNILLVWKAGTLSFRRAICKVFLRAIVVLISGIQFGALKQRLRFLLLGLMDGAMGRGGKNPHNA